MWHGFEDGGEGEFGDQFGGGLEVRVPGDFGGGGLGVRGGGGVADDGVEGDHAEGCFEDGEVGGVVVEGADDVGYEGEFVVEDVVVKGGEFRGRAGG